MIEFFFLKNSIILVSDILCRKPAQKLAFFDTYVTSLPRYLKIDSREAGFKQHKMGGLDEQSWPGPLCTDFLQIRAPANAPSAAHP